MHTNWVHGVKGREGGGTTHTHGGRQRETESQEDRERRKERETALTSLLKSDFLAPSRTARPKPCVISPAFGPTKWNPITFRTVKDIINSRRYKISRKKKKSDKRPNRRKFVNGEGGEGGGESGRNPGNQKGKGAARGHRYDAVDVGGASIDPWGIRECFGGVVLSR